MGVTGRLNNLGYFFDLEDTGDEAIKLVLQKSQKNHSLPETGEPETTTVGRLKAEHRS